MHHMFEGDYFGELEMLPSIPNTRSPVTIVAVTYCEVYFMKARDCFRYLLSIPIITRRLEKTAFMRLGRLTSLNSEVITTPNVSNGSLVL